MWNILRKPLLALSVGLNLAFIAMWLIHSPSTPDDGQGPSRLTVDSAVPSALHREIGVTEEQWRKIAPLVLDFRDKAGKQSRKINALRGQLLDLLTLPNVDQAAIREKQEEILAGQRRMQPFHLNPIKQE